MTVLTAREERALAQALSPEIAWRTVVLTLCLPIVQGTFIWLTVTGRINYWIATPVLGLVSYAYYTLVHESIHGNIFRNRRYGFLHTLIGWWGSLNLFYTWPSLRQTHILHHSHTNTDKDPDHVLVGGGFTKLLGLFVYSPLLYVVPYFLLEKIETPDYDLKSILTPKEYRLHIIVMHALQLTTPFMFLVGWGMEYIFLFLIPSFIGLLLLVIFFQWLPHYPFDEKERYKNTRISEWPFGDLLLLGQNLHLMHHLWPSVPFYNYRPLLEAMRPHLQAKQAQLDGFLPSRH